jgi:adenylate kinase
LVDFYQGLSATESDAPTFSTVSGLGSLKEVQARLVSALA